MGAADPDLTPPPCLQIVKIDALTFQSIITTPALKQQATMLIATDRISSSQSTVPVDDLLITQPEIKLAVLGELVAVVTRWCSSTSAGHDH